MRTFLNTLNPSYRLPYGCGTVAIANALTWMNLNSDFKQIQYFLQEKNFISLSSRMTIALDELDIDFTYQNEINIESCLMALNCRKGVILLTWPDPKAAVGHYSFFYRNQHSQLLENDKLSAPVLFKSLASKRSPTTKRKAMAWIIN